MGSSLSSAILTASPSASNPTSMHTNILNEYAQDTQNAGDKNSTPLTKLMRVKSSEAQNGNSISVLTLKIKTTSYCTDKRCVYLVIKENHNPAQTSCRKTKGRLGGTKEK